MKIFVKRAVCALLILLLAAMSGLLPATPAAHAEQDGSAPELRFGVDGTFTVLLLSDLQDTQFPSDYIIRAVQAVISDYPPDLIVLLGDQLEGGSPVLRLGSGYKNCERALTALLQPIRSSGIPFALVFGNHDYEAPMTIAEQEAFYRTYPNCIMAEQDSDAPGNNVFSLPVYASESDKPALNLLFFDSGADLPDGSYGAVSEEQVAWYVEQSEALRAENFNQAVPSVAFMHIILPEVYELFPRVPVDDPGAVRGVGVGADSYYRLASDRIFAGEVREAPCPSSVNNGLFDAFVAQKDVFLCVSGHDHVNSFLATLDGVDLLSAPGSTFTSYNDREIRGARLLRFTEHNIKDYETVHVRYSDYDGADGLGALPYYLTTTTRIPNAAKVGVIALLLLVLLVLLLVSVLRSEQSGPLPDMPADDEEPPEDAYL